MEARSSFVDVNPSSFLSEAVATAAQGESPYVLFLGAGASASSGIGTGADMIAHWCHQIFRASTKSSSSASGVDGQSGDYKKWKKEVYPELLSRIQDSTNNESEYGALFSYVHKTREQRQMFIEEVVSRTKPGLGYFYLAGLINDGRFKTVITTNFDDLVNDALRHYYDVRGVVCAFDSAVTSFSVSSLRPRIIKLHGDFLFSDIKNTDEETLDLNANMEEKLLELCEDRGLIVLGYSGADESVMAPIREGLRKNKKFLTKGVHWCVPNSMLVNGKLDLTKLSPSLVGLIKRFPDKIFIYGVENFDSFMLDTFVDSRVDLPEGLRDPQSRNLAQDFFKAFLEYSVSHVPEPGMRAHRRQVFEDMKRSSDSIEMDLLELGLLYDEGVEARERGDTEVASGIIDGALERIKTIHRLGSTPVTKSQWKAMSRSISLMIVRAKLSCHEDGELPEESRSLYLEITEAAQQLIDMRHDWDEDVEDAWLRIQYNGLCAWGLLAISDPDWDALKDRHIESVAAAFETTQRGRRQLGKLKTDSDVRLLVSQGLL